MGESALACSFYCTTIGITELRRLHSAKETKKHLLLDSISILLASIPMPRRVVNGSFFGLDIRAC